MSHEKEIQRMFLNEVPVKDIAEHFGMSREGIYAHLRKLPNFRSVSKSLRKIRSRKIMKKYRQRLPEIFELVKSGTPAVTISRQLDIPYYIITELLKGTRYDNTWEAKKIRDKEIHHLYTVKGLSQTEIGKRYGVAQNTVSNIIKRWENS